ncbi:MAG: lysophospholipid acyltransferase family protein [Bacillota bacterium]
MPKYLFYLFAILPASIRKNLTRKLARFFLEKYAVLKINGLDNIPQGNNVIFIANHLSNADGLILQYVLEKYKNDITFLAGVKLKDELLTNLILELVPHICIHPNKPDRKAIREAIDVLNKKKSLFIFPEGTRSRTGELLKGRSGVVLIAKNTEVPIIPIGIWGTEKLLPINTEGAMSKEWFNKAEVHMEVGKPFKVQELAGEGETIDLMMKKIAQLLPESYRGYYKKTLS